MNQVIGLFLVSYILSHPDVVPQWLSSFEGSRFGAPQNGVSICDHAGLRHKRDVGSMMGRMPLMNSSMMRGPMMHGHGPMMHGRGPMMHGEMLPGGSQGVKEKSTEVVHSTVLPRVDELMLPIQMMPDVGDMMPEDHDSVGVQLADVLSNPDNKISAKRSDDVDVDRDVILPISKQGHNTSRLRNHMDFTSRHRVVGLNAGEHYFMPNM